MVFRSICINFYNTLGYFICSFQYSFYGKKRQHTKRLLSQLSETDTDFVIGPHDCEAQTGNGTIAVDD